MVQDISIPSKPREALPKLEPLPGAEKEANAIANILNTKALTRKQATKTAVLEKISKAKIIHLVTHVLGTGESGVIILAPSGNDDGVLTTKEISNLKLNAELVVLSSNNTALGEITGDGVIGFGRAFMKAGTPSVIGSLWNVSDNSTAELMTEFYKNLLDTPTHR